MSFVSVPDTYSKPLVFALPISGTVVPVDDCNVPLESVFVSNSVNVLNASTSPVTNVISGWP